MAAHSPGTQDRGASAWLGRPAGPSQVFQRYRDMDRWLLSSLSPFTGGQAPGTLAGAGFDWWVHWLASPAK